MTKTLSILCRTLLGVLLLATAPAGAQEIYEHFPASVNKDAKYVFYSHGFIVEGTDPRPVNVAQGWGVYDFPAVKKALADETYHLIAFHRPKNTDPLAYATELEKQVRTLVEAGVPVRNITLVGFSRGGFITGVASSQLSDVGVNSVLLAACGGLVSDRFSHIRPSGHMLSIYEKSDRAGSCRDLETRSPDLLSFQEIEINTGLSHGAFFRPLPDWVQPLKDWIKSR